MSEIKTPPRKLVDLNAKFYGGANGRTGMGVTFDCPCGVATCEWGGHQEIAFANPLDGGPADDWHGRKALWQRTGDTLETLTLHPSLHMVGHWHGWLKDGVLVSC